MLIDLSNINHELEDLILELLSIKKPIYISSKSENVGILKKFNLVRLNLIIEYLVKLFNEGIDLLIKRVLDIFLSVIFLLVLSPILFLGVKFCIFSRLSQSISFIKRNGIYGKEFKMLKVRTMKPHSHSNREEMMDLNERKGHSSKYIMTQD